MALKNRLTALTLTLSLGASIMALPLTAAHASEEGKRNTALALGVAAVALLLTQKNKTPGIVVAGAAVLAFGAAQRHHDRDYRGHDGDRYYHSAHYNEGYQNVDYRNHDGNYDQNSYRNQDSYYNQSSYRNQSGNYNQDGYSNQCSYHSQNSNSGQSSYHNQERNQSNNGYNNNGSGYGYHQNENSDGRTARKSR